MTLPGVYTLNTRIVFEYFLLGWEALWVICPHKFTSHGQMPREPPRPPRARCPHQTRPSPLPGSQVLQITVSLNSLSSLGRCMTFYR